MTNTIRHIGIVVNDQQGALAFWRDLLGFSVYSDNLEKGPFIDSILCSDSTVVRTIKLRDRKNQCIELLHFYKNPHNSPQEKTLFTPGVTHIALQVGNINDTIVRLKENGYESLSDPQHAVDGNAVVVFVKGPENLYLELVELH